MRYSSGLRPFQTPGQITYNNTRLRWNDYTVSPSTEDPGRRQAKVPRGFTGFFFFAMLGIRPCTQQAKALPLCYIPSWAFLFLLNLDLEAEYCEQEQI